MENNILLTVQEVKKILRCSESFLSQSRKIKDHPLIWVKIGHRYRYFKSSIEEFLGTKDLNLTVIQ